MPHVVTDHCVDCRYTQCVDVCPVDCFHGSALRLYIDPEVCIDCAACVPICPVTALDKRHDGIVDVDQSVCIGCNGCMQACPYDALYIDDASGTAEKCHFCAHRTERGLAPACTVVCPTEALLPGDFDDPNSVVSNSMKAFAQMKS